MKDKKDKIIIIGLIFVLIVLGFNIISSISQTLDYEKRKDSGNDRWLQVENRIIQSEKRVNRLEEEIKNWKQ
mgnify:CR=1 FL=1